MKRNFGGALSRLNRYSVVCVPAVYLKLAFWPFLSFLQFPRINKSRAVS